MNRCSTLLQCPVCARQLERVENTFRCPGGHAFDVARQGYVNLVLSSGSQPAIQGDAREMLAARRRFLEAGHYRRLSKQLNIIGATFISKLPAGHDPVTILDAGCGEGYYLGRLRTFLMQEIPDRSFCLLGMDLAKDAVRLAAGRYKGITFFVANSYDRILLDSGRVDLLLNLFAPRNPAQFRRVLKDHGAMLIAIPSPNHLSSLRSRFSLLKIQQEKEEKVVEQMNPHFVLVNRSSLEYTVRLGGDDISALLRMTPNYWHLQDRTWETVAQLPAQDVSLSFKILNFSPR